MVTTSLSDTTSEQEYLVSLPRYTYTGPFEKAFKIAEHYGFSPIKPSAPIPQLGSNYTLTPETHKDSETNYIPLEEKLLCMAQYLNNRKSWPKPALVCYGLHSRRKVGKVKLAVYGSKKSIAEAIVIKTALAILREMGHQDLHIDINSLGCPDSRQEFIKEYTAHFKQHLNALDVETQTIFKNDPMNVTLCAHDTCAAVKDTAPHSISYLSEDSRIHFKEIIEYLESMDVSYRLNKNLLGNISHHSNTVFQIKSLSKDKDGNISEEILARGDRSEDLCKQFGMRKKIPVTCLTIDMPVTKKKSEKYTKVKDTGLQHNIYFVHLGREAKQQVLSILDMLREKNISVIQTITQDKLGEQMNQARALGVPYAMIMGLKEAQENVVIIREMSTRSQVVVPVPDLPVYLKKIA